MNSLYLLIIKVLVGLLPIFAVLRYFAQKKGAIVLYIAYPILFLPPFLFCGALMLDCLAGPCGMEGLGYVAGLIASAAFIPVYHYGMAGVFKLFRIWQLIEMSAILKWILRLGISGFALLMLPILYDVVPYWIKTVFGPPTYREIIEKAAEEVDPAMCEETVYVYGCLKFGAEATGNTIFCDYIKEVEPVYDDKFAECLGVIKRPTSRERAE